MRIFPCNFQVFKFDAIRPTMTIDDEKARLMEVRRQFRDNQRPDPDSEPIGPEYLIANACFKCRKSYKKRIDAIGSICPQCSSPLREMGRSFRAPKMKDVEQWGKVQRLWQAGFRFNGSGYHSGPAFPKRLSEVDKFIKDNPNHPLRIARNYCGFAR